METKIQILDLIAFEQDNIIDAVVTLPMDHYELEQLIDDVLFEGAIATGQRLAEHRQILAVVIDRINRHEHSRDGVIRLNRLLLDIEKEVA
ncbi:MAG: hypothetical protein MUP09_06190 [Thiovulaceae bacterium]|nr:hypothetical protein [Sulfurimonadaceae bacterium]